MTKVSSKVKVSGTVILFISLFSPCLGAELFPKGFHNGGTGSCDGCHAKTNTSANSARLTAPTGDPEEKSRGMFNGEDPSSTCLICHSAPKGQKQPAGYFVATNNEDLVAGQPPSQMTPGGDFGWLKRSYRWSTRESATIKDGSSQGERHGHNIIANQFGYTPDFTNVTAPGGSYPAEKLACTSCHDPHGNYRRQADGSINTDSSIAIIASGSYKSSPTPDATHAVGSYRMLAGKGYAPKINDGAVVFTANPPVAVAPDAYNRAEPKHGDTRVAYGSDMSEWCQNCHKPHNHPTGNSAKFSATVLKQYNSYVASGDMGGSKSASFSSLVPFENGSKDYQELKKTVGSGDGDLSGPKAGENIMCLTCHRAHATAWDAMTRWNTKSEFIVYNGKYPGIDNGSPSNIAQGRTSNETQKAYYDRAVDSFALYQRGLCSKCHAKD
ncbi:MAG TPA: hypothetical protein VGJ93_01280 [Desulfuromonadaceae bacterium]|jgi:hypothetical protein